jgi:hypothetical protein
MSISMHVRWRMHAHARALLLLCVSSTCAVVSDKDP